MNLSSTCGYSPRPPVSVYGTGACHLALSGFSREYAPRVYPLGLGLAVLSGLGSRTGLPSRVYTYPPSTRSSVRARPFRSSVPASQWQPVP